TSARLSLAAWTTRFWARSCNDWKGGADPLVRGRRPRRPAGALHDASIVGPAAGRGRPARTRGSAPPTGEGFAPSGKNLYRGRCSPPHRQLPLPRYVEHDCVFRNRRNVVRNAIVEETHNVRAGRADLRDADVDLPHSWEGRRQSGELNEVGVHARDAARFIGLQRNLVGIIVANPHPQVSLGAHQAIAGDIPVGGLVRDLDQALPGAPDGD